MLKNIITVKLIDYYIIDKKAELVYIIYIYTA